MPDAKLNVCFDVTSPFGYLAYYLMRNSPVFEPQHVSYTPVSIGLLHRLCENKPVVFIKNKFDFINKDRLRWAEAYNIPMRRDFPPGFPKKPDPTLAMRALAYIQTRVPQEEFLKVLDLLWAAVWNPDAEILKPFTARRVDGEFVLDRETVEALVGSVVACAREAVENAGSMKSVITANTEAASKNGAFGLPWYRCERDGVKESFWGFDHLGQVVRFLGLDEDADFGRSGRRMRAVL